MERAMTLNELILRCEEADGADRELIHRLRRDILALDDARSSTIYGGLFDAFSAADHLALKRAGLVRSYIPAGCMAPLTKLTPKGCMTAASLRAIAANKGEG
jgi:hypothetical protein